MTDWLSKIEKLSLRQRYELLTALKAAIASEIAEQGMPSACPRCGSHDHVGKGCDRKGRPRRLCKGCGHTFGPSTMTLLGRSKLPAAKWMEFACCMVDQVALRETARRCQVSVYTAWFMRMRACEVMSHITPPPRTGSWQLDGIEFYESLSGNHSKVKWFTLGRKPHRNGQDGSSYHWASNKACVITAINEYGDTAADLICAGTAGCPEASMFANAHVPKGSSITTDGHLCYSRLTTDGYEHLVIDSNKSSSGNINRVNSQHSRLRSFMRLFNGVSTRRLQCYLDWFRWHEHMRSCDGDLREVLFRGLSRGRYVFTRRILHLRPRNLKLCCYSNHIVELEWYSVLDQVV